MIETPSTVTCIACSVFREPLDILRRNGDFDLPVRYLDSMLHIRPERLCHRLESITEVELSRGNKVLLLYGDCHAHMVDQQGRPGVRRVVGANCVEILLGRDRFRRLRKEGAFFLSAEWATRWRECIRSALGSHRESVKCLMTDMHTKLIYCDTGEVPVPEEELQSFSEYIGLPWEVTRISPDNLMTAIGRAQEELKRYDS